jgi:hypothetical protein
MLSTAPGSLRQIDMLPMNQSWPELNVSPDGKYAIHTMSHLHNPVESTRNGIRPHP